MHIDRVGLLIEEFLDSDDDDDDNEPMSYPGPLRLQPARMADTNAKSIIDLPEDIILEVLEYFDLNMYMEEHWPLLYKYPREFQVPSVRRQFTRTVASRPDLAARVRYVVYEVHSEDFEGTRESRPGTESRQLYKHLVPQITIGDKRAFLKALYGGDIDAEYAFLFYLLPAMSTLRFSLPQILAGTISWTMDLLEYSLKSHRKTGNHGPFCSLRTLFLGWNSEGSSSSRIVISPEIVQNFATLPLLSDVSFLRPLDSSASISQPWDKFRSPIKSLHFLEATLPIESITGLFSMCRDLKRFSFNWSTSTVGAVGSLFGRPLDRFMQTVSFVPTLESLELSVMDTAAVWDSRVRWQKEDPIGQYLRFFRNLRHLKIAGFFLTGIPRSEHDANDMHLLSLGAPWWLDYNGLPISLEELVIDCEGRSKDMADGYDCDLTYLLPFLEKLANICIDGRLPNFKHLQLRGKYTPVYGTFEHVEALFAQAGVVVTLRGFPGEGCMPTSSAFDREGRTWSGLIRRDVWRGVGRRDRWGSGSKLLKPSAAKSILDLPTEILDEILSYLDPTGFIATRFEDAREVGTLKHAVTWRLGALADCCRVSKRFCEVSRPILYKVFCDYGKLSRRLRFINTVATYPNLAGCVKELHLGYYDSQRRYKPQEPWGITATFDNLMRKARTIEMDDLKDQWLQALRRQISPLDDVDLPVLLSLVPSLEVLSFGAHDKGDSFRFRWTFKFMTLIMLKLQRGELDANPWAKLRKFALRLSYRDCYIEESGALIITMMPFFSNLRSLQLTGGEGTVAEDDDLDINAQPFDNVNIESTPDASPIDTLHVEAGKMDVFTICIPIDAARALKSFTLSYTTSYAAMGMLAGAWFVVDRLRDHHASTLEHLALVPNERERIYGTDPHGNAPAIPLTAAQLRPFTALRHLELSACFLPRIVSSSGNVPLPLGAGSDIILTPPPPSPSPQSPSQLRTDPFPPSLERLTIDGHGLAIGALEDWLWALVERREHGALASLRAVELTRMMPDGLTEGEFLPLGECWTRAGVAFTVNGLWDAGMFFSEIADMPEGALDDDEPLESESESEDDDEYEDEDWYGKGDFGEHKELDGADEADDEDEDEEDEDEEKWNKNTNK
ncbi:hypothetical protein SLS58_008436 [Diplodia intermedia]|uniref:F-box domain-containing protein n=1 Tax=Diplodia intermedia TaxID=856260 RepID=A0ABR3THF3_9PEZI